ncbi:MAG: hypothetical protein WDW38_005932 [Sanguina aurantia]
MVCDEKAKKAAFKEGGKKGVDLDGVSALGGVSFFNISVETPEGDMELLEAVLEGANVEVDEAADERKGGAGKIGKMFFSSGVNQLAMICHVPKELAEKLTLAEWMEAVLKPIGGSVLESTDEVAKAIVLGNVEAGKFPIKMRDEAISAGFALLRSKGLVIDDDSDDENYAEAAGVEW